jgi:hypothetical protein
MNLSPLWLEKTAKAYSFTGARATREYSSEVWFKNVLNGKRYQKSLGTFIDFMKERLQSLIG